MVSIATFISVALLPVLFFAFWMILSTGPSSPFANKFPVLEDKRICLLIAHPDDEAMFFAPTLLALTKPELGNHVKILCLSSGDADGLGHIRKKELQKSAIHLGLRNASDVFVLDDPSRFPDSMTADWSATAIGSLLASAFAPEVSTDDDSNPPTKRRNGSTHSNGRASSPPAASIDILLTFDNTGVSNHPNHRSLYHGARSFLEILMKGKKDYACPVSLYTLTSTSFVRKYIGVFDAPVSMMLNAIGSLLIGEDDKGANGDNMPPNRLLFVSNINQWLSGWKAMVQAHKSQMVWFRWGWITIGRYMIVNDLKRETM
ncbi:N-acetylglucosaminyl-phosphatidylinositol de-N-acetylase [Ophidiomyces ophidiicola]|uniref:N-acetylglucosaminyl-phosphatidylinositol de-N-acetylase n=1 Tax=Ophidiomyces ophidiicola TaxID=1387563 RepID=A0ACB8UWZ6_9EURO|nr:N-acetylglucosaminyl-phosphatidylinositol de-N-acetylase [Ophidiomyces ophidiicola]KAI1946581.1 N-acetylglucosaminyl-phosphatidylinositol de-N-acetylase [Ophidiomyces ophidiicola]KAI1972854.1 N-acetylglucosaminyl-phosphatidylinositol de-N-acetylase [Ophidiomyces ophidiicola]KAI1981884.1 N-acetylglucosaminyl-phosphatidylinositol de-N-acetylase [Ophidiomyces ophidiicola]KAI1985093.1 N-acetylglucosaminyl-phosphatidylinositol de-N-acetylase [Ophidiomyces ophidiicola]